KERLLKDEPERRSYLKRGEGDSSYWDSSTVGRYFKYIVLKVLLQVEECRGKDDDAAAAGEAWKRTAGHKVPLVNTEEGESNGRTRRSLDGRRPQIEMRIAVDEAMGSRTTWCGRRPGN
ncbi:hypothetical protein HPB47_010001, partial [Ixodes persulcatus]